MVEKLKLGILVKHFPFNTNFITRRIVESQSHLKDRVVSAKLTNVLLTKFFYRHCFDVNRWKGTAA